MDIQPLKLLIKKPGVFIAAGLLIFSFGCEPPTAPTANVNLNVNTVVANAAPSNVSNTAVPTKESSAKMPITLPVLDAMFSEEDFTGELKTKLQLTDEQIEKVKTLSHQAVANLSENENQENTGSTRAALTRADKQIREALGDEKATALFDLIGKRWSNAGDTANNNPADASSKSGSIPTDTRIVVNAPAYRMDIFNQGKLVKSYKIGIGYPEFPLPSGMRKADTIIFNPTWTPPDEPWVKGKVEAGKKVEAGDKLNPLG
ncbi:MAG: L,D-transpeptidase, partial [Acidobacteriota bacterium]|nr:L,D-transpeptidase [Acidobacteriota bacterium]